MYSVRSPAVSHGTLDMVYTMSTHAYARSRYDSTFRIGLHIYGYDRTPRIRTVVVEVYEHTAKHV